MNFRKRDGERELNDEIKFHMEKEIQANIAAGMPPEEARRRAGVAFGHMESAKEECRELRLSYWIDTTLQDLGYGLRLLRKSPGFTFVAVAILALGIGANTAIFSTVNASLLARWPFPDPGRIVYVSEGAPPTPGRSLVSVLNFEDYRRDNKTFDQLALWIPQSVNLTGEERPDRLIGSFVSANFFDLFGTQPYMGRLFLKGEDEPGAANVVVLSHEVWQTRFGSDPNILSRRITLNNESYAVVGVLPRGYRLLYDSDVYITAQHQTSYKRDRIAKSLLMVGRVKHEFTLPQAEADLNTIAQRLARDYPQADANIAVTVTDFRDLNNRFVRTPLLILLVAVGFILLIACANLANLLMARGAQRQREMAVRAALGARRSRTIRQLLSEAMILAVIGGAAGIALAYWTLPALLRMAPFAFDVASGAVLDTRVLLFSLALVVFTGAFFGIIPALQLSHLHVSSALSSGSKGVVAGAGRERVRAIFVVCQVAMSIMLLIGAGLLLRSFQKLLSVNPGMDINKLLTMEYRLPKNKYKTPESQIAFHREMVSRVSQVPGVVAAAMVRSLPFSGNFGQMNFVVPGEPLPEKGKEPLATQNSVSVGYFRTAGIPLLQGRDFSGADTPASPPVIIVSKAFVDRYFGGKDAVGREIQLVSTDPSYNGRRLTVVGVVGNAKQLSLRDTDESEIYAPNDQDPGIFGTLIVRTAFDPMSLAESVKQAVWSVDKDQPVWKVRTLEFLVERDTEGDRFLMVLMTGFGLLALGLTALGTYGVLSNAVNQRQQELGVRMALGAQPGALRRLVMARGMKLTLIGGVIGLVAAAAASRLISGVLYGTSALDFTAYLLGLGTMTAIALVASYLPARLATRVDPVRALRCE